MFLVYKIIFNHLDSQLFNFHSSYCQFQLTLFKVYQIQVLVAAFEIT